MKLNREQQRVIRLTILDNYKAGGLSYRDYTRKEHEAIWGKDFMPSFVEEYLKRTDTQ